MDRLVGGGVCVYLRELVGVRYGDVGAVVLSSFVVCWWGVVGGRPVIWCSMLSLGLGRG